MKIIHLAMVWLVFQAAPPSVWGNCLRGPDSPHAETDVMSHVCEHEEHTHLRTVAKEGGGGGGEYDLLHSANKALTISDTMFPNENTSRRMQPEDETIVLFTSNEDFDRGSLINVNHDSVQDELQLDEVPQPFNFIWVACSGRGTIVKVDTLSGKVLGEYQTAPTVNSQNKLGNPSRTTVDKDGSVWVANRENVGPKKFGTIVHIGLVENNQCEERNGIPGIQTSTGLGDIRPWADGSGTRNISTAEDECIIHYTEVNSQGTRHISIDSDNNLWVGGTEKRNFDKVKGGRWDVPGSGTIMQSYDAVGFGGYGGIIDRNGFLWSTGKIGYSELSNLLRWDTSKPLNDTNGDPDPTGLDIGPILPGKNWAGQRAHQSYGLCSDSQGNVWVTELDASTKKIHKYSPEGKHIGSYPHGGTRAQGCVVDKNDHVWVAHSDSGSTVGHLYNNGTSVGIVKVGWGPTGVAVDGAGKIWTTNMKDHTISRINPSDNGGIGKQERAFSLDYLNQKKNCTPYNYGSMTGSANTAPGPNSGTWTVKYDHGSVLDDWGSISIAWNAELPNNSSLSVQVRNSEGDPWKLAENGQKLLDMSGQYLYVQVYFARGAVGGASPSLKDLSLSLSTLPPTTPPPTTAPPTPSPSGQAEVWVGHHSLQSNLNNFDQAKIWVISSNPDHHSSLPAGTWKPVPTSMELNGYMGNRKSAKFYSIGAGEVSKNLVGAINRPVDTSNPLHDAEFVMHIDNPAAFKARIEMANKKMNDFFSKSLLQYQAYPWTDWYKRGYGWVEYNSNGYVSGLLSYLGHNISNPGTFLHGWDKPVQKAFFEKNFTTNIAVKNEVFNNCLGGEAEVWVGYHNVSTTAEQDVWVHHAKLWVISSDSSHHKPDGVWKDLRQDRVPTGYKGDKNCAKFYTLGAGFSKPDLVPVVNYKDDVEIGLSGAVLVKSGVDPVSLMADIEIANKNVKESFENTDLKRETAFPRDWNDWGWGWDEFNGNGYISGLLKFLNYDEVDLDATIFSEGILPGWKKSVPAAFFDSACTSTLEAKLVVFNEHPAKNNYEYSDLVAEAMAEAAAHDFAGSETSLLSELDLSTTPVNIAQSALTSDPLF